MSLVRASVAQFPVSLDIDQNFTYLREIIESTEEETLLVVPEGAISGYGDAPGTLIATLDATRIDAAIQELRRLVERRRIHLIVGTLHRIDGTWFNSALYLGPNDRMEIYRKVNLAYLERGAATAGDSLPIFSLTVAGRPVKLGIQICREIKYPEQWAVLARRGAQIFAFLNNAVGDAAVCPVWRSHLVSRAAETQRFILGTNCAGVDQKCPTMIIGPSGNVLYEIVSESAERGTVDINLNEVSDWILSQARMDVVRTYG